MPRHAATLVLALAMPLCAAFTPAAHAAASDPCVPRAVVHGVVAATADQPAMDRLTVASLNMAGRARIAEALAAWTRDRSVDVLLLQEVGHVSSDGEAFVAALSAHLGLHFAYAAAQVAGGHTQGLAIVSRYPMTDLRVHSLDYFRLRFRSRCRIALAATAETAAGPVRVVNVHLDTRINSSDRVAQLAPVVDALRVFDGPRIIGGDFNTMNIRWLRTMWPLPYLQRQSEAVRAFLSSAGLQTPFTAGPPTFRFLGFPMRLDALYFGGLEPLEWGVDHVPFTDHRGVWARMERHFEAVPISR